MLELIRADRPELIIHAVKGFSKNSNGWYDVIIDTPTNFFGTTVLHTNITLPYPLVEYQEYWAKIEKENLCKIKLNKI